MNATAAVAPGGRAPYPAGAIIRNREQRTDVDLETDITGGQFEREIWNRVSAVDRTFTKVSFKFTVFANCYFRRCHFIDCDFTGAVFTDGNLRRTSFRGSQFQYCRFSRTLLEHDVIENIDEYLPPRENVQAEFARNLRANYAHVGDTEGVNKAILAELKATRVHLRHAGWPPDDYNRQRYVGKEGWNMKWKYAQFEAFDFLWGNGESPWKIVRTMCLAMLILGVIAPWNDLVASPKVLVFWRDGAFWRAIVRGLPLFFGVSDSVLAPVPLLTVAAAMRFFILALFTSVFVKRFARR